MVTQITLGNFGTIDGRTVLTGGASQIDTQGLIESLTAARRLPAVRFETRNTAIDAQTAAYNELESLFARFSTAVDTLRNPPGVGNDSQNIFQYRTANLTTSTGFTASNFLDVTVQPGAVAQNYSVDSITQLARQTRQQSADFVLADSFAASAVTASGSPTPGLFQAGTINLRAVDGTVGGVPLTLNAGDSLQTVAAKFNELSSRTGIQASVLTVAPGTFKLIYTATRTGTSFGFDLGQTAPTPNAGIESDPAGVFSQLGPVTTTQTAQNALFSIDGVALERETNTVADALGGVTFTLKQPTPGGSINVDVQPDIELVSNAITQFADAYNEFRIFASNQSQLDENSQPLETSVLNNSQTLRTIISEVAFEVSRVVAGVTGSNPSQLSEIGLRLENFAGDGENPATQNILTVDAEQLESALLANFEGVRGLFEYRQVSDNTAFVTSQRSNNLNNITGFQLVIDSIAGTYRASYTDPVSGPSVVDLIATPLTGGGVSLAGPQGSVFDGSVFVYGLAGDATVNVTLSQGFGDRFFNLIKGFTDPEDGILATELESLNDTKTRNTAEVTRIDENIARYREQLVQQYASLEAALSRANNILQLLDAQANARNNG